jgi:hypothetical protein
MYDILLFENHIPLMLPITSDDIIAAISPWKVIPPDWPLLTTLPVNIERGFSLLSNPNSVAKVSDNAKLIDPMKDSINTGLRSDI